jgi:hypothetical protein
MYIMITNINPAYSAFFRAIPYSGPVVTLTGAQPYDVVSNTLTLQAAITDLSGTSNSQWTVDVSGDAARMTLSANNTLSIDTKYAKNGLENINFTIDSAARVYAPSNPPANQKITFETVTSLPLDFENDTYLAFDADMSSPMVGTNYVIFGISKPQSVAASIKHPNGTLVASYSGYFGSAGLIGLPWNFTESDGVTPYSEDDYVVTFTAFDPTTLVITNTIDRAGVRAAAANILTFQEEDLALTNTATYLNAQAHQYIESLAVGLYSALYSRDFASIPQYTVSDIGPNRDIPAWVTLPQVETHANQLGYAVEVSLLLTNTQFSDFGYYFGHGNGVGLGGGENAATGAPGYLEAFDLAGTVRSRNALPNWRLRKVLLFACYTDAPAQSLGGGIYLNWPGVFGIRPTLKQLTKGMTKNVGLFFAGEIPQGPYSNTFGGTSAEVSTGFDELWVEGPNAFPGACDPTYSFSWAERQMERIWPEVQKGLPSWVGFGYLPFSGNFDTQIITNDITGIHN